MPAAFDHFDLFGLTPSFAVDLDALEAAYKRVQAQVHPDRFATGSAAERRVAMQWATRANEAYRVLRDPGKRAAYLCECHGVAIEAESNTSMPPAFLMQQMAWREALDDDVHAGGCGVDELIAEVEQARTETLGALAQAIDVLADYVRAAALVRQLMFIDRFRAESAARMQTHAGS